MERLTHERKSGMKTGYWSPNKKQELVDRLAMSEYVECYENLKAAVVKLAADDYRRALIRLRRHPKDTNALHTKNECELFFRKGIETYSDMDGEVLIKGIQERVRREYNEQRAVK